MKNDFEQITCLFCESARQTKITNVGQFGIPTHVVICKDCGLLYLNPRWTQEKYNSFYSLDYEKFYPRDNTINPVDFKSVELVASRITNYKSEYKNVLDIGSGFGPTLLYFKEFISRDALYFAIEPSKACIEFLVKKDIKIISETVDNNWNENYVETFDLIIMRHVLEHFLDPITALTKISSALSKGGLLYIAVPDAYHPRSPLNKYYFRSVHTAYFNKDTISNFLKKVNLIPIILQDNQKGELYIIAKKGAYEDMNFSNSYRKQKWIIDNQYIKEYLKNIGTRFKNIIINSHLKKTVMKMFRGIKF